MIILDVVQGTTEWAEARIGIPTASRFDEILTPKTMKVSASAAKYAWELIAEQLLGEAMDQATSGFMLRGSIMEKKALQFYELQKDVDTKAVGFVLRDDRRVGCSPDRFVGSDGLLEIKVPSAENHIGYLLDDQGIGYRCQVQGQLWLTGRAWCDTLSYHPQLPPALVRQQRDEEFIAKLAAAVDEFLGTVEQMKTKLTAKGLFQPVAPHIDTFIPPTARSA
jgi:hypothetical protein